MKKLFSCIIPAVLVLLATGCASNGPHYTAAEAPEFDHTVVFTGDLKGRLGIWTSDSERVQIARVLHSKPSGTPFRLKDARTGRVLEVEVLSTDEDRACRTFTLLRRSSDYEMVERTACHKSGGDWYIQ